MCPVAHSTTPISSKSSSICDPPRGEPCIVHAAGTRGLDYPGCTLRSTHISEIWRSPRQRANCRQDSVEVRLTCLKPGAMGHRTASLEDLQNELGPFQRGLIMSDTGKLDERRDSSLGGAWNRAQFELSLKSVGAFGFSSRITEYCRNRARASSRLPHEIVIEIVEQAVLRASRTD